MSSPTRRIRFFPDLGHRWSLWEAEAPEGPAMGPEAYGLSAELSAALSDWYDHWEAHFDPFSGWDSVDNAQSSQDKGNELVARLRVELEPIGVLVDRRAEVGI